MKWYKGPPPEIGWWPASYYSDVTSIRWWNGEFWSTNARPSHTAEEANSKAVVKEPSQKYIEWSERWWEEV